MTCALGIASPALGAAPTPEPAPELGPLIHPDGPGKWQWRVGVGAHVDILPRRVVESELRTFPLLTAALRLGLPAGFWVDAKIGVIYIDNEFNIGTGWSHRVKNFSFGLHDHMGMWVGFLGLAGFSASGFNFINRPGAQLGIAAGPHRFSLTEEAIVTLDAHTRLGDQTRAARGAAQFVGLQTTLVAESFFAKTSEIYYGFGVLWALADYEAWIAFADTRQRFFYPRFLAGYAF